MLSPLLSEQVLIEHLSSHSASSFAEFQHALVVSPGRAQTADQLQQLNSSGKVTVWFLDIHAANLAKAELPSECEVICSADVPEMEYDLVAMAILMRGEAELTRDVLQQSHQRMATGGTMLVSVDNPKDTWLREQLEAMFDKVTVAEHEKGRVYTARKNRPLKKVRNFEAEVVFRDGDHLIKLITRPGVFAHRQLDPGARQLLQCVEVDAGQRVLDLGCGSGALGIAACLRADHVHALCVDSNARAVACAEANAIRNDVSTLQTQLDSEGNLGAENDWDVVLCNPPYFSDFQIAEKMLRTAHAALRSGGAALFVNKQPRWYEERMPQSFVDFEMFESGKYWVACGRKS